VEGQEDTRGLRVLLVDIRPERRQLVRHLIESTGLAAPGIAEADDKARALELLDHYDADVVVLDIQMPVEEGLNTIAALRGRSPRLRIVVCSFHHEAATKARALAQGADAYLAKPVGAADLKRVLQRLSEEPPPGSRAPVRNHPC